MENKTIQKQTTKSFFEREDVKNKFHELMGKNSTSFITSVLQVVQSNDLLRNADPASIYQSACVSATLNLPINNSLGFAYIVPFNNRKKGVVEAQFQLGYKGFIQLAYRSGQFKTISAAPIYEGQVIEENPLTGFVFDFKKKDSSKVVGYASYFELMNGASKTLYLTVEEIERHARKYSQTYKQGFGIWKDDFDAMALKTVIKLLLSKYAPLSIEMQMAVMSDQSVIKDAEKMEFSYIDNESDAVELASFESIDKINDLINSEKATKEQKQALSDAISNENLTEKDAMQLIIRVEKTLQNV